MTRARDRFLQRLSLRKRRRIHSILFFLGSLVAIANAPAVFAQADTKADAVEILTQRDTLFKRLDTDHNKRLSVAEYVAKRPRPEIKTRDFKWFDPNSDGSISKAEFASMPDVGWPQDRGPMPDPYDPLLEYAIDAMDESYDRWNLKPDQRMNSTFFAINFATSLATDNARRLDREIVAQADPDGDHNVSRAEATRFLAMQLGVRSPDGTMLRMKNGRQINYSRFLRCDTDRNNLLTRDEFIAGWYNKEAAPDTFKQLDENEDGDITMDEFSREGGGNIVDPVVTFRNTDTNLDALIDEKELRDALPDYRDNLIGSALSGFDDDGDEKLSLSEYLASPLGNFNYPWASLPKDENNDDRLSYKEFVFFKRDLFHLQRRYFFHRLDLNKDKFLTLTEFEFKTRPIHSMLLVSIETGKPKLLFQRKDFPACGSPDVSPDGKWVAFDVQPPEGISKSRIMKMDMNGMNVHNLCDGLMPTWSPDGKQFACSRYEGGSGVWIMNGDGTPAKRISDGWGAQWSPDGKSIAYTDDNSLMIYDVESEKTRTALPSNEHPYQFLFWNMVWSPDSKHIAFKGRLPNTQQIAVVNVTGEPNVQRYHETDKNFGGDLAWSPDGKRIVFNMHSAKEKKSLIYAIALEGDDQTPTLVSEIPQDKPLASICFSRDGKWVVVSATN